MRTLVLAVTIGLGTATAAQAEACSDVAVVLAIDGSGSIDAREYALQIDGYRDALTSDSVRGSFRAAGKVAIAAVIWADGSMPPQVIPWHKVEGPQDLRDFAVTLASMPRVVSGNTDMGEGITVALDMLTQDGICAERRVIDVSGDGRPSIQARRATINPLWQARKRAEDLGVVINGLAIQNEDAELADFYRSHVATGLQSFVLQVDGFPAFREAIAQKLMREVFAGLPDDGGAPGRALATQFGRL